MTLVITPDSIDLINMAYKRIAADTRLIKRRVATTVMGASQTLPMADEIVRIDAAYVDSSPLTLIGATDWMRLASQTQTTDTGASLEYAVIGRTVYFWPGLAPGNVVTLAYSARPDDIDDTTVFELTGPALRLIDRVYLAYFLLDDGQPELAQRELADYLTDMQRLRRRDGRREGGGGSLALAGRRKRLV